MIPYLLVKQALLPKWLTIWFGFRLQKLRSLILVVNFKSQKVDFLLGFSIHPLDSKASLKSGYLPLMMNTLPQTPMLFFHASISLHFSLGSSSDSELDSDFFLLISLLLYFKAFSCRLFKQLNFSRYLYFPFNCAFFNNFTQTSALNFLLGSLPKGCSVAQSEPLPTTFMKCYRTPAIAMIETGQYLKQIQILCRSSADNAPVTLLLGCFAFFQQQSRLARFSQTSRFFIFLSIRYLYSDVQFLCFLSLSYYCSNFLLAIIRLWDWCLQFQLFLELLSSSMRVSNALYSEKQDRLLEFGWTCPRALNCDFSAFLSLFEPFSNTIPLIIIDLNANLSDSSAQQALMINIYQMASTQRSRSPPNPRSSQSWERSKITIAPEYLISLSQSVEVLNNFYEQKGLNSLSQEYKDTLIGCFADLSENLRIYPIDSQIDTKPMIQSSVIRCKSELQIYCLEKLGFLLGRESKLLGEIIQKIATHYRDNMEEFERAILLERNNRLKSIENEKDKAIERLKQQLTDRKENCDELKKRVEQLEIENSSLYHKMIAKAKNTVERALFDSPSKKVMEKAQNTQGSRESFQLSPAHQIPTSKQLEETIHDIMEFKQKHESVKNKKPKEMDRKQNMNTFLKKYFRHKFGMRELAEETENKFRKALDLYSQIQNKNIFILFQKLIAEECEENYFWERKIFQEKCIRILRRYLNEKRDMPEEEFDRLYHAEEDRIMLTEKDYKQFLIDLYKIRGKDSLGLIFGEILRDYTPEDTSASQKVFGWGFPKNQIDEWKIGFKKVLNQVLNYELQKHLLKIEQIRRTILKMDESVRGQINKEQFQSVIIELSEPGKRRDASLLYIKSLQIKNLTYSQAIEMILRIKKAKLKEQKTPKSVPCLEIGDDL